MAEYSQTTTFVNGNSADGREVNTEVVALGQSVNNIVNAQIDSAAAIAGSKIAFDSDSFNTTGDVNSNSDIRTTRAKKI